MAAIEIHPLTNDSDRPRPTTSNLIERFAFLQGLARGCRVAVLAVHHVRVGSLNYCGGAEKYIRTTLCALVAAGARVHVGYSGTSIYDDMIEGVSPRQFSVERTNWIDDALSGDARLNLKSILHRRRWLRSTGADIVFVVQQGGGGAFAASIVAAKSLGLRTVMSARQLPQALPPYDSSRRLGLIPSPQVWRRRLLWRRRLPALCCDAIIFNSHRVAAAYQTEYHWPAGRGRVIPNGEWPRMEGRTSALGDHTRPMIREIACVGRVTHAKGADTLMEAFAIVARGNSQARLTYFGDGPLVATLRERADALGLSRRVRFAGYMSDHDLIYQDVDLYVLPSRRESMSNSVLEAMARAIPCIVTNVGGLPELVVEGRTGLVIPPDSASACATAITRMCDEPTLSARMGAAGRDRVAAQFHIRPLMLKTVQTILGASIRSQERASELRSSKAFEDTMPMDLDLGEAGLEPAHPYG